MLRENKMKIYNELLNKYAQELEDDLKAIGIE